MAARASYSALPGVQSLSKRATNASKGSAGDADTATEDQRRRRRNALAMVRTWVWVKAAS